MAASPMILLPCISTLFTVNLDGDIRTGDRAQGAPRAIPLFLETDRAVAPGIVFMGGGDQTLFTCMDAQMAFLAKFSVDNDMSFQIFRLLKKAAADLSDREISPDSGDRFQICPLATLLACDPWSHHPNQIYGEE